MSKSYKLFSKHYLVSIRWFTNEIANAVFPKPVASSNNKKLDLPILFKHSV